MSGQTSGALFRSEFLDKDLLDFAECQKHYEAMSPRMLVEESNFLFRRDVLEIPFGFTGKRYYAFFSVLIECAADKRGFNDRERAELVGLIVMLYQHVRNRTEESSRVALDVAVSTQLEQVATYGLFPKAAELIRLGLRDYNGTFEEGVVGQILEIQSTGN